MASLDRELFGANAWSLDAWADELAAGSTRAVIVAVSGELVLGYAVLLVSADVADLLRLGVRATHQRSGLGSRLLTDAIAAAATAGCSRILLEVAPDNAPALACYSRFGFLTIARRSGYYPDGTDAVVMARDTVLRRL